MKRSFLLFCVLLSISCILLFGNLVFSGPNATIEWLNTSVNFGKIPAGKPVTAEFTFKNPGMIPIIIADVKSSCGCTVPEYPLQPIAPGKEGKIKVIYDAKLSGYFIKTITVYSNTEDEVTELLIKGEVVK